MSDLHIVPEGEASKPLDAAKRLAAAVESVNTHHADAGLCILAGDLADLGEAAAYERLTALFALAAGPARASRPRHSSACQRRLRSMGTNVPISRRDNRPRLMPYWAVGGIARCSLKP